MRKNAFKTSLLFLLIMVILLSSCTTSVQDFHAASDPAELLNPIIELTSERYHGRLAGTEGNLLAAKYLAAQYKAIGLTYPEGLYDYFQYYSQKAVVLQEKPLLQVLGDDNQVYDDFQYAEQFVLRRLSSDSDAIDLTATLIHPRTEEQLEQEKGKLAGKVLLLSSSMSWIAGSSDFPLDLAVKYGAAAVICEYNLPNDQSGFLYLKVTPLMDAGPGRAYKPFILADNKTFSRLEEIARAGLRIHMSAKAATTPLAKVPNVVGLIPGSDPQLKNQFIIIGAHFDHVGDNLNGTWNCGALDNTSGPAAMLAIAKAVKEGPKAPKKSILFIGFNGESSGQLGSRYYVSHPVYPLEHSVMINLDMVGASENIPLMIARPEKASSAQITAMEDKFAVLAGKLNIDWSSGHETGSDHESFAAAGVPSIMLTHPDFSSGYHSAHDILEDVSADRMDEVVRLVLSYIREEAY